MRKIILLNLLVIIQIPLFAQLLKGKIISDSGEPVPYATIYVTEMTQGIVADEKGNFQTRLNKGNYHLDIRSLGYENQTKTIDIISQTTEIEIILNEKPTQLKELLVKPSKENPALNIMRHAVARAPYHLYQVKSYNALNYMKGSCKIENIPAVLKMMIKDQNLKSLIGKLLLLESQSEVSFRSPSEYTQKVIAFKSSIPKEMTPKGGLRTSVSSIYQADFMGYISPLSPQAFKHYKFRLEDITENNHYQVFKIKVTPVYKNDMLFSGYLYINDKLWNIYAIDLITDEMGTVSRYKINYQEVQPKVFLPITFEMNSKIGTMGVKGNAKYYASIKYSDIKLNEPAENLKLTETKHNKKTTSSTAIDLQISKLNSAEKISTRDAIRLARLMKQKSEPEESKIQRRSLEIKEVQPVKIEVDSLAELRDSTYWESIRKVPLQKEEAASFLQRDSIQVPKSVKTTNNSIEIGVSGTNKSAQWLWGGNLKTGEKSNLKYDGLLKGILKEYNFVDGFWLGQKITYTFNNSTTGKFTLSPSIYYSTARKVPVWEMNSGFEYAPMSNGRFSLSFGNTSADIQGNKGTSRFLNSLSSLFFGQNAIMFYQQQYIRAENSIYIANGLNLNIGASYEKRHLLENNTTLHITGKQPLPNYPDAGYLNLFPDHSASVMWVNLQFTPFYRYRIQDDKKIYVKSDYPTFGFIFKNAFSLGNAPEQSKYTVIQFNIDQNLKSGEFDNFSYKITAGKFLSNKKLYSPDYKYFRTAPLMFTANTFDNSFELLKNYSSSKNYWLELHSSWLSEYLLLKRIGFLQKQHFNESLHFNLLLNENYPKTCIETGYSIGLNNPGRIGVFTSFDNFRFNHFDVKLSFPLFR